MDLEKLSSNILSDNKIFFDLLKDKLISFLILKLKKQSKVFTYGDDKIYFLKDDVKILLEQNNYILKDNVILEKDFEVSNEDKEYCNNYIFSAIDEFESVKKYFFKILNKDKTLNNQNFDDINNYINSENISINNFHFNSNVIEYQNVLTFFPMIEFFECNFDLDNSKLFNSNIKYINFKKCRFLNNWKQLNDVEIVKYKNCEFKKYENNSLVLTEVESLKFTSNCKFEEFICNNSWYKSDIFANDVEIKNLIIKNCIFDKNVILSDKEKKEFIKIELENTIFNGKFKLRNSKVEGKSKFKTCKFKKLVDFFGTEFINVSFKDSRFYKMTVFTESEIKEKIDFQYTYFFDIVQFKDIVLNETTFDFSETTFEKPANFLNLKSNDENKIVANRETARIIKDSFERQNNLIEANKYYKLEMIKMEDELSKKEDFSKWLIFKIHGLTSNHSQDWLLSLFWILSFSFTYSTIDCINNLLDTKLEYILIDSFIYFITILVSIWVINLKKINNYYLIIIFYVIYIFITKDFTLKAFSNNINPFSIMTEFSEMNFSTLIYKIIIGYLIYQLIISIRQNTRRK